MPVEYVIRTTVHDVIRKSCSRNTRRGAGGVVSSDQEDLGWYLHLAGSHEALFLGVEEPDLRKGDPIEIRIRRASEPPGLAGKAPPLG